MEMKIYFITELDTVRITSWLADIVELEETWDEFTRRPFFEVAGGIPENTRNGLWTYLGRFPRNTTIKELYGILGNLRREINTNYECLKLLENKGIELDDNQFQELEFKGIHKVVFR